MRRDDALDDAAQLLVAEELRRRQLELALALDVDPGRAVDHDLADRRVGQQVLERAEAERLVEHLLDQARRASREVIVRRPPPRPARPPWPRRGAGAPPA